LPLREAIVSIIIIESDAPNTAGPASPPDPTQDRPATTAPGNIAFLLHGVSILLGYGGHLLATIRHRAAAPTFPTIAAAFGTAHLPTILAHLNRGILRAAALERFLLARAATGYGGNVGTLMREKTRRGEAFAQQPESSPESNWDWRDLRREVIRQVLGFFIGEEPVDPFAQHHAPRPPARPDRSQIAITRPDSGQPRRVATRSTA